MALRWLRKIFLASVQIPIFIGLATTSSTTRSRAPGEILLIGVRGDVDVAENGDSICEAARRNPLRTWENQRDLAGYETNDMTPRIASPTNRRRSWPSIIETLAQGLKTSVGAKRIQ